MSDPEPWRRWTHAEQSRLDEMAKTQPDEWSRFVCAAALARIAELEEQNGKQLLELMQQTERIDTLEAEVAYEQERNRNNVHAYSQELTERTTQLQRAKAEVDRAFNASEHLRLGEAGRAERAEAKLARVLEAFSTFIDAVAAEGWCQECGVGQERSEPLIAARAALAAVK